PRSVHDAGVRSNALPNRSRCPFHRNKATLDFLCPIEVLHAKAGSGHLADRCAPPGGMRWADDLYNSTTSTWRHHESEPRHLHVAGKPFVRPILWEHQRLSTE